MEFEQNENAAPSRWAGLQARAVSAAAMAAAVLLALWAGGWWFTLLVTVIALLMIREWDGLTAADNKRGWTVVGLAYAGLPCASLIWLRDVHVDNYERGGLLLVLTLLLMVWATDIGAYFAGRIIGGAKLAPTISPGKTWAGLGGGIGAAAVAGAICYIFTPFPQSFFGCAGLGIVIALVSQGGDLFESWLKRRANVKDSGTLIPGHGGILDRVDGLVFAIPLFALLVKTSGIIL